MPTTLADIIKPALRMAGMTPLPGSTPSSDQYGELISVTNRMMSSFSLDGHRIYTSDIVDFPLVAGRKVYSIGPGGDFDAPRPIFITAATIIFPTSPAVRYPMQVTLDEQFWMSITVQDISGAPPWLLYYDGGYKQTPTTGLANIYLYPQPPSGYTLELSAWTELKDDFTAITDAVILPPGYEEMMTLNLAIRVAAMYPLEAKASTELRKLAADSLYNVIISNTKIPSLRSEAAYLNRSSQQAAPYGLWFGGSGGGGTAPQQFSTIGGTITGTIDGVNDTFSTPTTLNVAVVYRNGMLMTQPNDVTFAVTRIVFQSGQIPQLGDILTVEGWA